MSCFKVTLESSLDIFYEGDGNKIARAFYIPVLKQSSSYKRVSGYFSVDSLVVVATGLAGLIKNNGKMSLILGAHDLGKELSEAYVLSRDRAQDLLKDIGERISLGLERVEDILTKRRIEAIAWMLANGTLEIRVAIPKRTYLGLGNGIFHEKVLLFDDKDGCRVAAAGSANETLAAYSENGENLTVHMSWKEGHLEYLERYKSKFESLWSDTHPDYYVLQLPEALEKKLKERFYPGSKPELDPLENKEILGFERQLDVDLCSKLVPAARLVKELGKIRGFAHLGLGPVRLYPHQIFTVDFALSRFPHRILLADEVGLGKTLEAGAIIKRLVDMKRVQRILILSPKNVARQWLDELWDHFGLRFWLFVPEFKEYVAADGSSTDLGDENPFERSGIDFMISSWHYARGSKRRPSELMQAGKFFDLVIVDEAHNARMKRESSGKVIPSKLNELCNWVGVTSPNVILLTATPVQLRSVEALDLLKILGLGGPWVHESDFKRYYEIIGKQDEEIEDDEWLFAFQLAGWIGKNYVGEDEMSKTIRKIFNDEETTYSLSQAITHDSITSQTIQTLKQNHDHFCLKQFLLAFSPVQWFMVRNTRENLEKLGYVFPERVVDEIPVDLDRRHKEILEELDEYLSNYYAKYERYLSPENKGVLGFVRSIYHQRFVSSFSSAYLTVKNRRLFLEALLEGDRDTLLRAAERLLVEEEWEGDEDQVAETMKEALDRGARRLILAELNFLRDLESKLQKYDPRILSGDDPKLDKLVRLIDSLVGNGHKVLAFSKYTDTVDVVVRFLGRNSSNLTKSEIGKYTGEGGKVFELERGEYISVGKEEVRRALDSGPLKVLVCSDAASEGLNLQSASAVVNVDMPWNPARVEQRIGRVDRLGQKAAKVLVKNIWYPDSIEAHMYKALFDRKEIYKLVVGPAQEIFSDALRKALDTNARGEELRKIVTETFETLQSVKEEVVKTAGSLTGREFQGGVYQDDDVIDRVLSFAVNASKALGFKASREDDDDDRRFSIEYATGHAKIPQDLQKWNAASLEEGMPNALTPANPIVQFLADRIISEGSSRASPYTRSVYLVGGPDGLAEVASIEADSEAPEILSASRVLDLLDDMLR